MQARCRCCPDCLASPLAGPEDCPFSTYKLSQCANSPRETRPARQRARSRYPQFGRTRRRRHCRAWLVGKVLGLPQAPAGWGNQWATAQRPCQPRPGGWAASVALSGRRCRWSKRCFERCRSCLATIRPEKRSGGSTFCPAGQGATSSAGSHRCAVCRQPPGASPCLARAGLRQASPKAGQGRPASAGARGKAPTNGQTPSVRCRQQGRKRVASKQTSEHRPQQVGSGRAVSGRAVPAPAHRNNAAGHQDQLNNSEMREHAKARPKGSRHLLSTRALLLCCVVVVLWLCGVVWCCVVLCCVVLNPSRRCAASAHLWIVRCIHHSVPTSLQ